MQEHAEKVEEKKKKLLARKQKEYQERKKLEKDQQEILKELRASGDLKNAKLLEEIFKKRK